MIVPKHVIKQFLNRKLDDNRYYKDLTDDELQALADKLPVFPPIWYKLDKHQKASFLLGAKYGHFFYQLDTGMGKTLLSIALVRYFRKLTPDMLQTLVLVPNKINKGEWKVEIDTHCKRMEYVILTGSSEHKWEQLRASSSTSVVVETYGGLARMVCEMKYDAKKKKDKLVFNTKLVRELVKRFDGFILDESTEVCNASAEARKKKGTLAYRVCRQIAKESQIRFALTGTPFGKDPTDLWAQMYLIDKGATLGTTLGMFRAAFFTEKQLYWGGAEYTFKETLSPVLHRMLANRAIRYEADKSTLPNLVPRVKRVMLPDDALVYADKAMQAIRAAHGNYREQKNAFLRMRQISSGFLGYYDDEEGVKARYEFPTNPKLEMLTSLIESIDPRYKIIVFNEFTYSGTMICRELKRLKIGYVRVYGKTKDTDAALHDFRNDLKTRVFLLQNASGAFGLNLQIAKYGIFYESPVSPKIRRQAVRRFERQRSEHDTVFQYDLVTLGTYDQDILDAIAAGRHLFEQIVEGRKAA